MATKTADKFKCPKCGSGRTKPLSVAIAGGTRRRNTVGISRRSMWSSRTVRLPSSRGRAAAHGQWIRHERGTTRGINRRLINRKLVKRVCRGPIYAEMLYILKG
jgi:hypothetical protein